METFFLITNIVLLTYIAPLIAIMLMNYSKYNFILVKKRYLGTYDEMNNVVMFVPFFNLLSLIITIQDY